MKHAASRELYAYWEERRGRRAAPERAEIEPGAIRGALSDAFILSLDAARGHPLRLAGTRVCALFDRELRGEPFLRLWAADSRTYHHRRPARDPRRRTHRHRCRRDRAEPRRRCPRSRTPAVAARRATAEFRPCHRCAGAARSSAMAWHEPARFAHARQPPPRRRGPRKTPAPAFPGAAGPPWSRCLRWRPFLAVPSPAQRASALTPANGPLTSRAYAGLRGTGEGAWR